MGILNVTPDSFSDGGSFLDGAVAAERALEMVNEGVDIIDVGGESTRPGAAVVSEAEELRRTIPVIEQIRAVSDIPISIDTMKSQVALRALTAGANVINDVSAFEADDRMATVAVEMNAGVVLMHKQGSPQTMQAAPCYDDVVQEVFDYLMERVVALEQRGMRHEQMVIDLGIGFGKTLEHNLALLRGLDTFAKGGLPLLVGASRKRFLGALTGREDPKDRRAASLGVAAWAAQRGAHILRVHDVIDTCDVCSLVDTLISGDR
jgi:dihydropteroate synthase